MKTTHQKSSKIKDNSSETPKKGEPSKETSDAVDELQQEQQPSDDDSSYSGQHDVTPPVPHPFPSIGIAETDFVSQGKHGRKTGTMIDHEPGI